MRLFRFLSALFLLLVLTSSGPEGRRELGSAARIDAVRVALDPGDPSRLRVGALTYLGGVRLKSPDPAFGGFSAMRIAGDRFTLVSDGGNVVSFRMGSDFRPSAIVFGDLPDGPRTGWRKADRDSESLAWDPASGKMWVGFENSNAIWRYDAGPTRAERRVRPAAMRDWSRAGGPEAMVRLHDGTFLVISESTRPDNGTGRVGLRFAGDPTETKQPPMPFVYIPPAGYDPSDMAELPDGRLIVLNRRFALRGLFSARLTIVDPRGLHANAVLRGEEIATLAAPLIHDNYEAIVVTREGDDTILWIASDDNSQFWEQSLLLKFRLEPGHAKSPLSAGRTGRR